MAQSVTRPALPKCAAKQNKSNKYGKQRFNVKKTDISKSETAREDIIKIVKHGDFSE